MYKAHNWSTIINEITKMRAWNLCAIYYRKGSKTHSFSNKRAGNVLTRLLKRRDEFAMSLIFISFALTNRDAVNLLCFKIAHAEFSRWLFKWIPAKKSDYFTVKYINLRCFSSFDVFFMQVSEYTLIDFFFLGSSIIAITLNSCEFECHRFQFIQRNNGLLRRKIKPV